MLDERPTAVELVDAVAGFLERDVIPELTGRVGFHAKVAVNALRIVERELAHGEAVVNADRAGLAALPDAPAHAGQLAEMIRDGSIDAGDPGLRDHLVRSVLRRLGIDNPRYPSLAEARDRWPDLA